jgi:hypothetical protein
MSDQATEYDFAAAAAPVDQHKMLQPFVGKFKAEVKLWMGPGDPQISTGTMLNTMELGDRFLQQDYHGDAVDGPFFEFCGKGFWGYNKITSQFEGFWIDTASTMMQTERGSVADDGKTWTMTGDMVCGQTGESFKKRSVITLVDQDHHFMETYVTGPDGNEMKTMEIQYQRIA